MTAIRSAVAAFAGLGAILLLPAAAQAADYQVYKDADCAPNAQCAVDFPKVPKGKTLTIENVSCYLRFSNSRDELGAAQLVLVNKNGSRDFAVTPSLRFQDDPPTGNKREQVFVSNDIIKAVGKPGQRFRAYAVVYDILEGTVSTVSQLSCGISGELN